MCDSTFLIPVPRSLAETKDGGIVYMLATCGQFFYPTEDVEFCPECKTEMDAAISEYEAEQTRYFCAECFVRRFYPNPPDCSDFPHEENNLTPQQCAYYEAYHKAYTRLMNEYYAAVGEPDTPF